MKFKFVKALLFLFVLVVIAYAVYMAYNDISKHMPVKSSMSERFEQEPKLKICLYKATWCSHCTSYLKSGVFDDTYKSIKDDPNYKDVVFVTLDFDENKKLAEKYNINSFPSIIAVDADGQLLDAFEGNRESKQDLIHFVDTNKTKV